MLTGRFCARTRARRRPGARALTRLVAPARRAGDAPGDAPGDAHARPAVRARADHRRRRSSAPREAERSGYRYSFDMLGEAARTAADAERYREAYRDAIAAIGARRRRAATLMARPGISVKLSALHPRYEIAQRRRLHARAAAAAARAARARRARRDIARHHRRRGGRAARAVARPVRAPRRRPGARAAGTASASRCRPIRSARSASSTGSRRWPRRAQPPASRCGWSRAPTGTPRSSAPRSRASTGYPVFTRKVATDVSYLACARRLLAGRRRDLPQFATHNAHTVASDHRARRRPARVRVPAPARHGRGAVRGARRRRRRRARVPRLRAGRQPQGPAAYLVRRLLENGANTSFVNRIADAGVPVEELIDGPGRATSRALEPKPPSADPAAGRPLRPRAAQRAGHRSAPTRRCSSGSRASSQPPFAPGLRGASSGA